MWLCYRRDDRVATGPGRCPKALPYGPPPTRVRRTAASSRAIADLAVRLPKRAWRHHVAPRYRGAMRSRFACVRFVRLTATSIVMYPVPKSGCHQWLRHEPPRSSGCQQPPGRRYPNSYG
jgi:hypothetical protein